MNLSPQIFHLRYCLWLDGWWWKLRYWWWEEFDVDRNRVFLNWNALDIHTDNFILMKYNSKKSTRYLVEKLHGNVDSCFFNTLTNKIQISSVYISRQKRYGHNWFWWNSHETTPAICCRGKEVNVWCRFILLLFCHAYIRKTIVCSVMLVVTKVSNSLTGISSIKFMFLVWYLMIDQVYSMLFKWTPLSVPLWPDHGALWDILVITFERT